MAKRKRDGIQITAVPHATRFILLDSSKEMPRWMIERIFPMDSDDAVKNSQWSSGLMHLCALNYYVLFAAKKHYKHMRYMAEWIPKAFDLFEKQPFSTVSGFSLRNSNFL